MRWAVFLDRDGTINEEVEYLGDPADLRLIPGAAGSIRLLNEAGVPVIVVSNQAGVGRGYFTEAAVEAIHQQLAIQMAACGASLDAIFYCPHHPDEGCECRKPSPGLLKRAASELGIDLGRSFVVGDKISDLVAGSRAGCRTVLVLTGHGAEMLKASKDSDCRPDHVACDVREAIEWILVQRDGVDEPVAGDEDRVGET